MSVNVNRSVSDQFYRYKMPRLIAKVTARLAVVGFYVLAKLKLPEKFSMQSNRSVFVCFYLVQVEGKGNGIKTVIVNMVDVAKALNRPPTCKYDPLFVLFQPLGCRYTKPCGKVNMYREISAH